MPGPTAAAGGSSKRSTACSTIPPASAAPAAVQHRHPLAVRERDRQAVGHQHQQPEPRLARDVAVHLASSPPGSAYASLGRRRRPTRAMSVPCTCQPIAIRSASTPAALGQRSAVLDHALGLVVGEDPQVERLVRALAHAAPAGRERRPAAPGQPRLRVDSPRELQRRARAPRRGPTRAPSSLRRSVSSSARPMAGPSGTPAASRSSPVISSRDVAQVGDPAQDRLRGRAAAPAPAPAPPAARGEQRAQLRGRVLAARAAAGAMRGATRAARDAASRSSRLAGAGGEPQVELLGRARRPARRARSAPRSAPVATAPSAAEATSSGSGSSSGCSARVRCPSSRMRSTAAGASVSPQQVQQLVAHPRAGHGRRARRSATASRASALGLGVEREPEPRLVAHRPQEPRGVVEEAARRAAPGPAGVEVAEPAVGVVQVPEVVAA